MEKEEEKKKKETEDKENSGISDPETLHTTDPQEHMEGPVSSLMHKVGHGFEDKEAEKKKKEEDENK
jgi:hypothetical protein